MTLYEQFTEQQWALLQQRARRVEKAVKAEDTSNLEDVLIFSIGPERYAVPITMVQAVYEETRIHPLPTVEEHIAGIANVRGHITTVLNIAMILNIQAGDSEQHALVMLDLDDMFVGLQVEQVREVIQITSKDLKTISGEIRPFIKGVFHDGTVLLDLMQIIMDPMLTIDQK